MKKFQTTASMALVTRIVCKLVREDLPCAFGTAQDAVDWVLGEQHTWAGLFYKGFINTKEDFPSFQSPYLAVDHAVMDNEEYLTLVMRNRLPKIACRIGVDVIMGIDTDDLSIMFPLVTAKGISLVFKAKFKEVSDIMSVIHKEQALMAAGIVKHQDDSDEEAEQEDDSDEEAEQEEVGKKRSHACKTAKTNFYVIDVSCVDEDAFRSVTPTYSPPSD